MTGRERIEREIAKCVETSKRNTELYGITSKRIYYRRALEAYTCAKEMEAILRAAMRAELNREQKRRE